LLWFSTALAVDRGGLFVGGKPGVWLTGKARPAGAVRTSPAFSAMETGAADQRP